MHLCVKVRVFIHFGVGNRHIFPVMRGYTKTLCLKDVVVGLIVAAIALLRHLPLTRIAVSGKKAFCASGKPVPLSLDTDDELLSAPVFTCSPAEFRVLL